MTRQPTSAVPVRFPAGYGRPDPEDLQDWGDVEEKLRSALNYWLTTVGPAGTPHARPVDGVWVDGALCFGGSPDARWARNLQTSPAISVHLPSDAEAIIIEGSVEQVSDPSHPLAEASTAATRQKYPQYFSGEAMPFQPFWVLRPSTAYAWRLDGFPQRATRWTFEAA